MAALKSKAQLPELFAELQRQGVQTPFAMYVGQDAKQATRYIVYVNQSGLGLPDRDYYLKQEPKFVEIRAAYVKYVGHAARRSPARSSPRRRAKAILALETALAEKQWERAKNRDRELTYNLKSVAELDALTPGFSWTRYLKAAEAQKTPGVVVRQPDYLQAAAAQLAETAPAGAPAVPHLQGAGRARRPTSPSAFEDASFAFRGKTLQGLQENRPRWKRGVAAVEDALGEVVGQLYVERHFSPAVQGAHAAAGRRTCARPSSRASRGSSG